MSSRGSTLLAGSVQADRMDANYRWQRFIYDLTRRFYLLGRVSLLERLPLPKNGRVLEVGCGTAWNLIRLARRHPGVRLDGLDASQVMLTTARARILQAGFSDRIQVSHGLAEHLAESGLVPGYDAIFFSYALSMIPEWRVALAAAVPFVRPGGALAVVDFGDLAGLPRPARRFLRAWLRCFHTQPRDSLPVELRELAAVHEASLQEQRSATRYTFSAIAQF